MKLSFVFYISIILLPFAAYSKPVKISGKTANAAGYTISVFSVTDYVSNQQNLVKSALINPQGEFSLAFDVNETAVFFLDIADYQSGIYLEGGKSYQIDIDSLNLENNLAFFSVTNPRLLIYRFSKENPNDLNVRIGEFYQLFDSFVLANFSKPINRRNPAVYDSLLVIINNEFVKDTSVFFRNIISYNLAHLEYSLRLNRDDRIFLKYIQNKAVLIRHPAYMVFFNEFFDQFLVERGRRFTLKDLDYCITVHKSYKALTDTLGKDSVLRNQYLRDVVLLRNMINLYKHPDFRKADIIEILRQASVESPYPENRRMAVRIISQLSSLSAGSPAPDFNLSGIKGDTLRLENFRGKYVLLAFVNSNQLSSLQELAIMTPWIMKYRKNLQIVSVHLDDFKAHTINYVSKNKPEHLVATASIGNSIIKDYQIYLLPSFVLIDPAGYILQYPARKPSEDFEGDFKKLLNIK